MFPCVFPFMSVSGSVSDSVSVSVSISVCVSVSFMNPVWLDENPWWGGEKRNDLTCFQKGGSRARGGERHIKGT